MKAAAFCLSALSLLTYVSGFLYAPLAGAASTKRAACPAASMEQIDVHASEALHAVTLPPASGCAARMSHGFPVPDPECTPGAINPTLTQEVLADPAFRTACVRNKATTAHEKAVTYRWYGIKHPAHNTGRNMTCELDHLVSLELGGADTLDNIWPQCGPRGAPYLNRYFKEKDTVENYFAWRVKNGDMDLSIAQKEIAAHWPDYYEEAENACPRGRCPGR